MFYHAHHLCCASGKLILSQEVKSFLRFPRISCVSGKSFQLLLTSHFLFSSEITEQC